MGDGISEPMIELCHFSVSFGLSPPLIGKKKGDKVPLLQVLESWADAM